MGPSCGNQMWQTQQGTTSSRLLSRTAQPDYQVGYYGQPPPELPPDIAPTSPHLSSSCPTPPQPTRPHLAPPVSIRPNPTRQHPSLGVIHLVHPTQSSGGVHIVCAVFLTPVSLVHRPTPAGHLVRPCSWKLQAKHALSALHASSQKSGEERLAKPYPPQHSTNLLAMRCAYWLLMERFTEPTLVSSE